MATTLSARQFKTDAKRMAGDLRHRGLIQTALRKYEASRDLQKAAFQDWQQARQSAAERKWEAINHLDTYLEALTSKLEARGTKVHWASTAEQAREIILGIVREKGVKSIIKSKAMTAEEIHLNEALERTGYSVVESDLGEYIVQLRHEAPYHIVFPAMHLTRGEISALFEEKLGSAPTENPEDLTMIARKVLRDKYVTADVGITGANFAVAETGMISITENEGNARLTAALPKTMITLMGIEKIVPKLSDLALFLPMLATAGAGQALTGYNSMYGGPRQPGECDGPEEYHVVLIDNSRTALLADPEQRDALHCIRCGACLNVCPIYRNVGGHAYGTTYSGPVGSVITPHLRGLHEWKHLSQASSLCGACTEACPVKIDLHHHLLQNRRNAMAEKPVWWEKMAFHAFGLLATHPELARKLIPFGRFAQMFHWLVLGGPLDPAKAWTETRDLPPLARHTFTDLWRAKNRSRGAASAAPVAAQEPSHLAPPIHGTHETPAAQHLSRTEDRPREKAVPMTGEKEKIFRRIREALSVAAPYPGRHAGQADNGHGHDHGGPTAAAGIGDWLPSVGQGFDARVQLFAKNSTSLKSTFHLLDSEAAAAAKLAEIAAEESWQRVAAHADGTNGTATRAMVSGLNLPGIWTDTGYDVREMEQCDAGISECDALVAQTGSVLVSSRGAGGRALSVLPPHHVVLARREQLVADLPEAFAILQQKYADGRASFIGFITGPSRTGDIERILVLGAHGPKKLTILCW